jgi:hypothetical protein
LAEQMDNNTAYISHLQNDVTMLRIELEKSQIFSTKQHIALESLLYVTRMPECELCGERIDSDGVFCFVKTTCQHSLCSICWAKFTKLNPLRRCPWRTCPELSNSGLRLLDGDMIPRVGPCSVSEEYTRDDVLKVIGFIRTRLEADFTREFGEVTFSPSKPPLVSDYLKDYDPDTV